MCSTWCETGLFSCNNVRCSPSRALCASPRIRIRLNGRSDDVFTAHSPICRTHGESVPSDRSISYRLSTAVPLWAASLSFVPLFAIILLPTICEKCFVPCSHRTSPVRLKTYKKAACWATMFSSSLSFHTHQNTYPSYPAAYSLARNVFPNRDILHRGRSL